MNRRGRIAAFTAVVAALIAPGLAEAGYGVQPIGQTFAVTTSGIGYITTPERIIANDCGALSGPAGCIRFG